MEWMGNAKSNQHFEYKLTDASTRIKPNESMYRAIPLAELPLSYC